MIKIYFVLLYAAETRFSKLIKILFDNINLKTKKLNEIKETVEDSNNIKKYDNLYIESLKNKNVINRWKIE